MEALIIRHVKFEDAGSIADTLLDAGFNCTEYDAPDGDLESMQDADLAVIAGGPISANDIHRFPWLQPEIEYIRRRIDNKAPTLGICLGAQLMAKALGAGIKSSPAKEIGWSPVQLTEAGLSSPLKYMDSPVLHWHGEMFDLPDQVPTLATTPICPHQAFALGSHALALQFHLEVTGEILEHWLVGHIHELDVEHINPEHLRRDARLCSERSRQQCRRVMRSWLAQAFDIEINN